MIMDYQAKKQYYTVLIVKAFKIQAISNCFLSIVYLNYRHHKKFTDFYEYLAF